MNYYPRISNVNKVFEPASWVVEPVKIISHGGISGLMECNTSFNPRGYNPGEIAHKIPKNFYGKELVTLATGTDEEILEVSRRYGLLVSPFARVVRKWLWGGEGTKSAESIGELATDEERVAIHSSILLAAAQRESKEGLKGAFVSFAEIRSTAAKLLDAQKVISVLNSGISLSELSDLVEKKELPSFPIQKLKYIEYCLRDSNLLGIPLVLEDENKRMVKYDEADAPDAAILGPRDDSEVDTLRQWNLFYEIMQSQQSDIVSFTEALALDLRNLAMENRTWAHCEKCGAEFPLSAGQLRKVKNPQGIYCSEECRNAASQKRYRDKLKIADPSASSLDPQN